MDYIYLDELYPNQNVINGFENLNYNKNIFYGSESLKDTISRMYQAIVKFIQKIWNWIKEQFRKLKSLVNFNKKIIKDTETKIKENEEILKDNESKINTLNTDNNVSKNISKEGTKKINGLADQIVYNLCAPFPDINISDYSDLIINYEEISKNIGKIVNLSIEQELNGDDTPLYTTLLEQNIISKIKLKENIENYLNNKRGKIPSSILLYTLTNTVEKYNFKDNIDRMHNSRNAIFTFLPSIKKFISEEIEKNSDCTELLEVCILFEDNLNNSLINDYLDRYNFNYSFQIKNEDIQNLIQHENIDNSIINNTIQKINELIRKYQNIIIEYTAISEYVHSLIKYVNIIVLTINQELKNNKN